MFLVPEQLPNLVCSLALHFEGKKVNEKTALAGMW